MRQINNILLLFSLLLLYACIKGYNPVIDSNVQSKYVVSGRITDVEGWQEIEVSLSAPVQSPGYIPVRRCMVRVQDDKGNDFVMQEFEPGLYRVWMRSLDLIPGTSYRVQVFTPDEELLESGFETMPNGPPLDSVYYFIEDIPTPDPTISNSVMQFYIDLNAVGNYSQFYKWEVVETWEYHAAHPAQYYYDGSMHEIIPPDYSNKVCWKTQLVKNVFTISTKSLSQNRYKKYPLQTVDGHTSRLGYLYSTLVSQLSLSEGAYNYWERLRINSNEQGGLYEKQPLAIKGNLNNLTNPEKDVLGYFYATTVSSRRYFYQNIEGIYLDFTDFCYPTSLGMFGWKEIFPWEYPVYFYYNEIGALRLLSLECIDCRRLGGTTVKPDFWPIDRKKH